MNKGQNMGVDIGFHSTKYVTRRKASGQLTLDRGSFPSFVATYTESALSLGGDQDTVITLDDHMYLVGDAAVKKSRGGRKEIADWVSSVDWRVLFTAALAAITDRPTATAHVVVGLPLSDYHRKRDIVKATLEQTWSYAHARNGQQIVTVEKATVIPQAWGAILCQLLDVFGQISNSELVDTRQAVIDIGGHTVNYLGVDGLADIPEDSHATSRGSWTVMRHVRDFYNAEYPELNRHADHAIMQHIVKRQAWYGGQLIDLSGIVDELIENIGQEIVDTAQSYLGAGLKTYRNVYIIGGGAYLFGRQIKETLSHAVVLDMPEYANADGFYRYSVYLARKEKEHG